MAEQAHQHQEHPGSTTTSSIAQFAEDVAGTVLNPSRTLRDIGARQAIIPSIFLILLIVAISGAGQLALLLFNINPLASIDAQIPGIDQSSVFAVQVIGILWNFVWAPVLWTIVAGILFGIAKLFGGSGQFTSLWAATGFSLVPQLLVTPISTAGEFLSLLGPGWQVIGGLALFPVTIGAMIWTLALFAIAVRETMGLTTGRAVGTVGVLVGGLIMLAVLVLCAFILIVAVIFEAAAS